jgi:alpha,alpha-trehalose phosphorylase
MQSIMAAEVGHLDLAYDYFGEAALMDLDDLEHNTRDGLHIASMAGAWLAVVAGFGGLRDHDDTLALAPRLPDALNRLCFRLTYRESRLVVDVGREAATYTVTAGDPLELLHHGDRVKVGTEPSELQIPCIEAGPRPQQPPGREPFRRPPRN